MEEKNELNMKSVDMQKIRKAISKALKSYRKENGLTQVTLAELLGYSEKTIAQWEQCNSDVPLEIIILLRNGLGKNIDDILELNEKELDYDKIVEEYMRDEDALKVQKAKLSEDDLIPVEEYLKGDMQNLLESIIVDASPTKCTEEGEFVISDLYMKKYHESYEEVNFLVKKNLIYDVKEVEKAIYDCSVGRDRLETFIEAKVTKELLNILLIYTKNLLTKHLKYREEKRKEIESINPKTIEELQHKNNELEWLDLDESLYYYDTRIQGLENTLNKMKEKNNEGV